MLATLVLGITVWGALPRRSALASEIFIGSEAPGSFAHHAARVICRAINRSGDDLKCQVLSAPNGVHNLTNLHSGSLDLALLDSRLLHEALTRGGQFAFLDIQYKNFGTLVPLYQEPITLIARADAEIGNLGQLKGKRINAGITHSATRLAVETILEAKSWTQRDFDVVQELPASLSQDTLAFCHGSIQAMVHIGVHPDAKLQHLLEICEAVPVNMDDSDVSAMLGERPDLVPIQIPARTYPAWDQPVTTFGTTVFLMASESMDAETVQAIMGALQQNQEMIRQAHPALGSFNVSAELNPDIGIPRQAGAAEYLKTLEKP
jgi:TRAP transporter TAXI family solute receptor